MNQRQLQNARTALWRQDGRPLLTQDDAVSWLDEMGLCLFLPRHAQLPAPGASFVEARSGEGRAAPLPDAIREAMELTAGLVTAGRAIPLNLMGTYTEQPDFLASTEALRWIASVRGDRQWKAAPGGRTTPIVSRVWEALDRQRGRTAAEIQEELGRELTEAAVLRALVELWTTLRAVPEYVEGEPTRWTLLRDRHPKEMAAGANTAQATALSALISLYLRQAVAATEEEVEIFLSPLTARSRIREVLHGMLASRQLGTMAIGVQTLMFVEGSLPEVPEEEEQPAADAAAAKPDADRRTFGRSVGERTAGREPRGESRREPGRGPSREFSREPGRGPRRESGREFGRGPRKEPGGGPRREAGREPRREFPRGPKPEGRPDRPERKEFAAGRKPGFGGKGMFSRGGEKKPWEKREEGRPPRREGWKPRGERPAFGERRERRDEFRRENRESGWESPQRPRGPSDRPPREAGAEGQAAQRGGFRKKPWQDRGEGRAPREGQPPRERTGGFRREGDRSERRARGGRPFGGKPKFGGSGKPGEKREARGPRAFGARPGFSRAGKPGEGGAERGARPFGGKPKFGGAGKPGEKREARGPRAFGARPGFSRTGKPGEGGAERGARPFGGKPKFGGPRKPGQGRPAGGPDRGPRAARPGRPGGRFGKPGGGFRKGGKQGRPQGDRPRGAGSGKNRKGKENEQE